MRTRIALLILLIILAALLVSSVVAAQSGGNVAKPAADSQGIASGGHYHLTVLSWHANGASSGGGYRLQGPASPSASSDKGCCCSYLPCALRMYP